MALVVVTAQNCRVCAAEATTNFTTIGGGPGVSVEPDFVYQGCNSISRRGQTSPRGIRYCEPGCCVLDLTTACGCFQTVMYKVMTTSPGLLDANFCCCQIPFAVRIGTNITCCGCPVYHQYDLLTLSTYPSRGSWQIVPVDVNIASHRSSTSGSPPLCAITSLGMVFQVSGQTNNNNMAIDALDLGIGMTLTRGDGCCACDCDGTWDSFTFFDEGTIANRFGFVSTQEGILFVFGKLIIGECANATEFTDTCQILIFPDGLFADGFSGISLDVRNACTAIVMTGCQFLSKGVAICTCIEETRAVFEMTSDCAPGTAVLSNIRFDAFSALTLRDGVTFCCVTITNSLRLTHLGGLICGATVLGATTGNCVAFIVTCNPGCVKKVCFTFSDGHAIELTTAGCYTFAGNIFTGYSACDENSDSAIFNSSGGAITLNITCCGTSAPSVRNAACSTTCIVAATAVCPEVTNLIAGDTVTMMRRCGCVIVRNQFSLAACNCQGCTTLIVGATIGCCVPQVDNSKVRVLSSSKDEHRYRYDSFTAATFTLSPCTNGTADAGSSTTILVDAAVNFITAEVEEGDLVRNETDDVIAKVRTVCCATTLTTCRIPLTWEGKAYRINALVQNYPACACAYAPIIERIATGTEESTALTHLGSDIDVRVSVRNAGVIQNFNQNQTITNAGLSTQAVRVPDNIFN